MRFGSVPLALALGLTAACAAHVVTTPAPVPAPGERIRYSTRSDTAKFTQGRLLSLSREGLSYERFFADPTGRESRWVTRTVPAESLAQVQVRVGRRRNIGGGAAIGLGVGFMLGLACAAEESGFVTAEECLAGYAISGAGTGALIGLLVRNDVWAPVNPPDEPRERADPRPQVTLGTRGLGIRIPLSLRPLEEHHAK